MQEPQTCTREPDRSRQSVSIAALVRSAPRLGAVLAAALAAIALMQLMVGLWAFRAGDWRPAPSAAEVTPANKIDLDALVAAELFGSSKAAAGPDTTVQVASGAAPDLSVVGIFSNEADSRRSRALIRSGDRPERSYAVGDFIDTALSVKAIFPDRVAIQHRGGVEILKLALDRHAVDHEQASPDGPPTPQKISTMRTEINKDPAAAATYFRMQPNMSNGQAHGIRIFPGKDRALFEATGLWPGDIVTAVNGVTLNDPGQAEDVVRGVARGSTVSLAVERAGKAQTLSFAIPP
jgi:general secretion pathway protein C